MLSDVKESCGIFWARPYERFSTTDRHLFWRQLMRDLPKFTSVSLDITWGNQRDRKLIEDMCDALGIPCVKRELCHM